MESTPLTLSVLRITPTTLLTPDAEDLPLAQPLPQDALPLPTPPPHLFSPTHAYPSPYPIASLGSLLSLALDLRNTKQDGTGVTGVRMMCEVQSPAGRYRLGEAIHGQPNHPDGEGGGEKEEGGAMPDLEAGKSLVLDVDSELKELGLHVLILSVAWETVDGRRTFQRFFKFTVNPPLAIKTRIQNTQHPNTSLDAIKREHVYLEVLAQNVSPEGIVFDKVALQPVQRLTAETIGEDTASKATTSNSNGTLMPGDTKQYLFLLSPSKEDDSTLDDTAGPSRPKPCKKSVFPPDVAPGSILPLGRLDLTWRSGLHHDSGRLQTSTLNRRLPLTSSGGPIAPTPSRTTSALGVPGSISRTTSPKPPVPHKDDAPPWEYDLTVLKIDRDGVEAEEEFEVTLHLGIRSTQPVADIEADESQEEGVRVTARTIPPVPRVALQHLSRVPASTANGPNVSIQPSTPAPMTRTGSATSTTGQLPNRPFSPPTTPSRLLSSSGHPRQALSPESRPMTPVSTQLRQAVSSTLSPAPTLNLPLPPDSGSISQGPPFPPRPYVAEQAGSSKGVAGSREEALKGRIIHLGSSLQLLPAKELEIAEENMATLYGDQPAASRRWEQVHEVKLRFMGLQPGLCELGGIRVLDLSRGDDGAKVLEGSVGREWDSLGDILISA